MRQQTLSMNGRRVNYFTAGQGKPVVLIHGFGEDSRIWEQQIPLLEKRFWLLIPDLPGSGSSEALPAPWNMEIFAGIIKGLLDAESIQECTVIGHSMGGYVTLAFVELFPERLHAFGLVHSTSYADPDPKKEIRNRNIAFIREHGGERFIRQTTPNLFSSFTREERPALIEEVIDRYTNFSEDALVHYSEAMRDRPDRRQVLKSFGGPVLFIIGEQDNAVPVADSLAQCHLPALSYVLILNRSGHMGMLEEPVRCNPFLEKFLIESEMANS